MRLLVEIAKNLQSRDRSFALDVKFASSEDLVVIFGPSGAGKSITLQALAGLIKPDRGLIRFGDRVLFDSARRIDVPARQRRIGYMFQDYALFPHMTVAANVAAPLAGVFTQRLSSEARERVETLLASFELSELRHSYPSQLSGGQRQRTALARALASDPELLLLDEPFAAVDSHLREKMRAELLHVRDRFKLPILMISHDEADARLFARELIVLENGRVKEARPVPSAADSDTPMFDLAALRH